MNILFWVISIGLIVFEMVAGVGKILSTKMAIEGWLNKLKVSKSFMSAFGGLEVGAILVILLSLFYKEGFYNHFVPWACLLLGVLKIVELILQYKANEPFNAMVGPIVVLILTASFYFLRQSI